MSAAKAKPRRVRVPGDRNSNIYERYDGKYEVGYRDSTGKQRWPGPYETITRARAARDDLLGRKGRGERVLPNPRLKFGVAANRWLEEQVVNLRPATRARYESHVRVHLLPRWGGTRMDAIDVNTSAALVRALRVLGLAESTISGILRVANRIFKFARRRCGWHGEIPFAELEEGERPKVGATSERRIYEGDELAQVLSATTEPWITLFRLADVVGGRQSELLGLWWEDLDLRDPDLASITFSSQVDRKGARSELKTEESRATLPLPRATALMLLEHRARSIHTAAGDFVFASRTGRAMSQRNVLRALYRAQERARTPEGQPTFPELFEHDQHGCLVVNAKGRFVPNDLPRKELRLPHFHGLRHTAAMDCDDAEEARDLLRHKNSNVTRAVYRAHFTAKRHETLRAKMEARHRVASVEASLEATDRSSA